MEKYNVIIDLETGKYYTGEYWETPWTRDILRARVYSEEEIKEFFENLNVGGISESEEYLFEYITALKIETVYLKQYE